MSLESNNNDKTALTLEMVKLDFLNWRRDPHRSNRIPESLWDKVIQLLSDHPKSKVLTHLGMTHSQLNRKLKSRQLLVPEITNLSNPLLSSLPLTQEKNTFVKAMITTEDPSSTYFNVLLKKSNGATLQINKLSPADMFKLTELFTG